MKKNTMDKIWEDMDLTPISSSQKANMSFQELLTTKNHQRRPTPSCRPCSSSRSNDNLESPATVLDLNIGQDFQFPETHDLVRLDEQNPPVFSSLNSTLDGFVTSSVFPDRVANNRASLGRGGGGGGGGEKNSTGDLRYKRMMKNRESASRSRARKQAYTLELEVEIAQYKKENDDLKTQLKKVLNEASKDQLPIKKSPAKTFSSPF